MPIITAAQEEYLQGIPFPDLASLEGALVLFGEGVTPWSEAAYRSLVADGYGFRPSRDLEGFIKPVFDEIDERLKRSPSYTRTFIDNEFSPFLRISVQIDRTADGCYILSLYATYSGIGKKVEDGLASAIGMPQALRWSRVNVIHSPSWNGKFEIDLGPIAQRLADVGYDRMTGAAIAETIVASVRKGGLSMQTGRCTVAERASRDLGVSIALDATTVATCIRSTVVADGSIVRGQLRPEHVDQARRKFPTVHITVDGEPAAGMVWQDLPILDPQVQENVRQLAARITAGFKS